MISKSLHVKNELGFLDYEPYGENTYSKHISVMIAKLKGNELFQNDGINSSKKFLRNKMKRSRKKVSAQNSGKDVDYSSDYGEISHNGIPKFGNSNYISKTKFMKNKKKMRNKFRKNGTGEQKTYKENIPFQFSETWVSDVYLLHSHQLPTDISNGIIINLLDQWNLHDK